MQIAAVLTDYVLDIQTMPLRARIYGKSCAISYHTFFRGIYQEN